MSETFWVVLIIFRQLRIQEENIRTRNKLARFQSTTPMANFLIFPVHPTCMKNFPFRSVRGSLKNYRARGKKFAFREGVSVVETTVVMVAIVGCLVFLMGGFSGRVSNVFEHTERALGLESAMDTGSEWQTKSNSESESHRQQVQQTTATEQILRMVIFTASVLVFLAYTVVFMTRAESSIAPTELEQHPASSVESKAPERTLSFASKLLNKRGKIGKILRNEMAEFDSDHLQVAKFMTPNPTLVLDSQTVPEVVNLISANGFRHLLVVDSEKCLVGIISDRDLIDLDGKELTDVMTANPISVEVETPVSIAITIMVKNRISALPVMHESKVVGILTNSDLLLTLQCLLVNVQEEFSHKDITIK